MCVSGTVPFLHLSLEGQENLVLVTVLVGPCPEERGKIEFRRRSDDSRNTFQEHLRIMRATSSMGTKDGRQIALRTKISIFHLG